MFQIYFRSLQSRYAVLVFTADNSVDYAPNNWLVGDFAVQWPEKIKLSHLTRLRRNGADPQEEWNIYKVRILGLFDTEEEARKKSIQAQITSDMEEEEHRRRLVPQRYGVEIASENVGSIVTTSARPTPVSSECAIPEMREHSQCTEPSADARHNKREFHSGPDVPAHKPRTSNFEELVLRKLNKLDNQMRWLLQEVTELKSIRREEPPPKRNRQQMPFVLPCSSLKEVLDLEEWMKGVEKENRTRIFDVGGLSAAESVRNMLSAIMKSSVAINFNWNGSGEKRAFSSLPNLCDIITSKVKQKYPDATNMSIKQHIQNWLKHSSGRGSPRKKKLMDAHS